MLNASKTNQRGVGFGYVVLIAGLVLGVAVTFSNSASAPDSLTPKAYAAAGELVQHAAQLRDEIAFAFDARKATAYSNVGAARHPSCFTSSLYIAQSPHGTIGVASTSYSAGIVLMAAEHCAPRLFRTSITGPLGQDGAPIVWLFGMHHNGKPSVYGWTTSNVAHGSCVQVNKLLEGVAREPGPAVMVFPVDVKALSSHPLTLEEASALDSALGQQTTVCVQDGTGYRVVSRFYRG